MDIPGQHCSLVHFLLYLGRTSQPYILYMLIIAIISSVTFGIGGFLGWVIWSFKYNEYYTLGLIEKCYRFVGSDEQVYRAK